MKPRVPAGRAGGGGRLRSQRGAGQGPGSPRHSECPSLSSPFCHRSPSRGRHSWTGAPLRGSRFPCTPSPVHEPAPRQGHHGHVAVGLPTLPAHFRCPPPPLAPHKDTACRGSAARAQSDPHTSTLPPATRGARGRTGASTLPGPTLRAPRAPQNCRLCPARAAGAAGGLSTALCFRWHGAGQSLCPHCNVSPAEARSPLLLCVGLCAPSTPSPPSACPLHPSRTGKRQGLKPASVLCGIKKSPKIRHMLGRGSGLWLLRAEEAGWPPRPVAEPSSSSWSRGSRERRWHFHISHFHEPRAAGAREWICLCSCRSLLICPPKQGNVSLLCQI